MPDGKPSFSGVWNSPDFGSLGGALPLQPWAQKLADERKKNGETDDPEAKCLPGGVPRISPYPMKIVQTPDLIVMLFEGNVHSYRQFFLDGRGHDKSLDPSFMGDSIARWEGDTLVVDTVNFNVRDAIAIINARFLEMVKKGMTLDQIREARQSKEKQALTELCLKFSELLA
jgi:hypothetical protein